MTTIKTGSATDTGLVRVINQDQLLVADPVFAVADGMGGHAAGEVAALIAVRELHNGVRGQGNLDLQTFEQAVQSANLGVWRESAENPELRGMGTTITALAVLHRGQPDERLAVANVGDSRTYRLRDGELAQVTADHSYVAELVAEGQLRPEEAETHPQRHVLTRALGMAPGVLIDVLSEIPVQGDRYLLCSDGLSKEVPDPIIASVLRRLADPSDAARELVAVAKERGGSDNITVVIVDLEEVSYKEPLPTPPDGTPAVPDAPEEPAGSPAEHSPADQPTAAEDLAAEGPAAEGLAAEGLAAEGLAAEAPATQDAPAEEAPAEEAAAEDGPDEDRPAEDSPTTAEPTETTRTEPDGPEESSGNTSGSGGTDAGGSEARDPAADDTAVAIEQPPVPPAANPDPPADPPGAGPRAEAESKPEVARRRWLTGRVVLFVVALVVIIGLAVGGLSYYARDTYFVGLQGKTLTIFKGRPGGLLLWNPTVADKTGVTTDDVEAHNLPALKAGVQEATLGDARAYIKALKTEKQQATPPPTTTTTTTTSTTTVPKRKSSKKKHKKPTSSTTTRSKHR